MEFIPWPKTARLYRDVTVTEKIDGTNAAIRIEADGSDEKNHVALAGYRHDDTGEHWYQLGAQSRNRLITPDADNYGFAAWVKENAESLVRDLGPGSHFGEWWGSGIQRGYGIEEKRFSLFNTAKWAGAEFETPQLHTVPVLYQGVFNETDAVDMPEYKLSFYGSSAAPGFRNPEGICIFHSQSRRVYKYTLDGDGHKG